MIIFAQDWNKYTAFVDYSTKNTSFKRVSELYRQAGVKNHAFMLALYQKELVGVDPFSPDLTVEQMTMIRDECIYNPWYFFREVVRFKPNGGGDKIPFAANRANIALIWCYLNHLDFLLIQPRQTGKSGSSDALFLWVMFLCGMNTKIMLLTKDDKLRRSNIERLKGLRDNLPPYIYVENKMDASNNEIITCKRLGNEFETAVARSSEGAADKLGRGLSTANLVIDEFAYIDLIDVSLPVALASGSAVRKQIRKQTKFIPYGNIYLTTAGNRNTRSGKFAFRIMMDGTVWTEKFLDCFDHEELMRVVAMNKPDKDSAPLINGSFNHRQIGQTDEEVLRNIRESRGDRESSEKDFLNIWPTGGEGSPLLEEEKRRLVAGIADPLYTEITKDGYILNWHLEEKDIAARMASSTFVIGLDTSDALGGDNDAIGLYIMDTATHETIALGRYNETNTMTFALFVADLLIKYPSLTLIFERRSTGMAIFDMIVLHLTMKNEDPFRRIFNKIVDEPHNYPTQWEDISRPVSRRSAGHLDKYKRYFGFATSSGGRQSRDALYKDAFHSMLQVGAHRIRDRMLINELTSLEMKNGRIDHSSGGHDDLVISSLLAHWLCKYGKNLHVYGIKSNEVFIDAEDLDEKTPEEKYTAYKTQQAKARFNELYDAYKTESNSFAAMSYELKLRMLSKECNLEELTGLTLDAWIEQAQGAKNMLSEDNSEYRYYRNNGKYY